MINRLGEMVETLTTVTAAEPARIGGDTAIKDAANLFRLLADQTRLRILTMLSERDEMCVRELWERLGQSQPAVSHHLGLLRAGGVVDTRHEGKHIYYRINPPRFEEVLGAMRFTQVGLRMLSKNLGRRSEPNTGEQAPTAYVAIGA
jgi:DNA-binding transcriptional ArsR family regulator